MQTIAVSGGRVIHVQPSPRARRLYWHLLGTGRGRVTAPQTVDAYALPGASILWLQSGEGEMRLSTGTYHLRTGPYFWLFSTQQDRQFRPLRGKPYTVATIRFGGPNLGAWLDELEVAKNPFFRIDPPDWVYALKSDLMRLAVRQPADWEQRVHLLLSDALCRLLALRKPPATGRAELPPPLVEVLDAIAARPDHPWHARDLPAVAGVSYSYLRDLFRDHLHETIHEFLQKRRLDRARMWLAENKLSVKEISQRLHFGNEFYFSSFFRKQTGFSPTQFQKHLGLK